MSSSKPLGRGLSALLGQDRAQTSVVSVPSNDGVQKIELDQIVASTWQPRKIFSSEALKELAASIQEKGVLQPLTVRRLGQKYELIAGERRWRASKLAGLKEVPVMIKQVSDEEVLEWALIENLQREDLNPIEEAEGYGQLQQKFSLTQEQIAQRVGKSRPAVANAIRLLELDEEVKQHVAFNRLSVGHAKVLLGLRERILQCKLAQEIIKRSLTVRQTETLVQTAVKGSTANPSKTKKTKEELGPHLKDLQSRLRRRLATQVTIHHNGNKGRLEINYYSLDELNRIVALLGVEE